MAGGSGSFGAANCAAATAAFAGRTGLSAGGVTFAAREVAGSSGRTGSVESFGFAAAFATELPAEVESGSVICFFSGVFVGFAVGAAEAGGVGPGGAGRKGE